MKTTPRTTVLLLGLAMLALTVCGRAQAATVTEGTPTVTEGTPGPQIPPGSHLPPGSQLQDLAGVTFTVTDFNDVCAPAGHMRGGLTQATMLLTSDMSGNVRQVNATLHVKAPGATFKFIIVPDRGAETYYPIGIAFVQEDPRAANDHQRLGLQVFHRLHSPNPQFLLIGDHFPPTVPKTFVRYKFYLVLQRGSDGKLGIIDPGIVNES
jgi:hypothetical protein